MRHHHHLPESCRRDSESWDCLAQSTRQEHFLLNENIVMALDRNHHYRDHHHHNRKFRIRTSQPFITRRWWEWSKTISFIDISCDDDDKRWMQWGEGAKVYEFIITWQRWQRDHPSSFLFLIHHRHHHINDTIYLSTCYYSDTSISAAWVSLAPRGFSLSSSSSSRDDGDKGWRQWGRWMRRCECCQVIQRGMRVSELACVQVLPVRLLLSSLSPSRLLSSPSSRGISPIVY